MYHVDVTPDSRTCSEHCLPRQSNATHDRQRSVLQRSCNLLLPCVVAVVGEHIGTSTQKVRLKEIDQQEKVREVDPRCTTALMSNHVVDARRHNSVDWLAFLPHFLLSSSSCPLLATPKSTSNVVYHIFWFSLPQLLMRMRMETSAACPTDSKPVATLCG